MKIVFVRPPADGLVARAGRRHNRAWPPLDLLNCAALARLNGAEVHVLDCQASAVSYGTFIQMVRTADFVFVTTSSLDRWQCPHLDITASFEFIRNLPSDRIYVMGAHGTIDPNRVLTETGGSAVVRGEPEGPVRELSAGRPIQDVSGISYFADGKLQSNRASVPLDLKSLPLPAYDLVNLRHYSYELLGPNLALLETTRGCSYACTFCFKTMYGKGVREKSCEQIAREIESVVKGAGRALCIYFFDLEFTLKRDIALHVCDVMKGLGGRAKWCCQTRADLVDGRLLHRMAQSGCELIHYGIETGSQRILNAISKRITVEKIRLAIKATHSAGIRTACFFLFGFPGETRREMLETLRFAKSLSPTYASFHTVTPYPGTPLYNSAFQERQSSGDYELNSEPDDLKKLVRRAFLSYYVRPGYIFQTLRSGKPRLWKTQARLFLEFVR